MGNIVLLDELTINKIAAGEVIERPASVVKEMVENSIDAGASNITVEIKNGGISYIRITDNGKGIAPDDMEIAFERHATSKIRQADDLENVKSMGFRGEALASIAAIANVEMISRTENEEIGKTIVIEGGKILKSEEIGCQVGTIITVQNLFFNTPVRYKFLKKDFTESGYIEDAITRLALANPNIAFKLINTGKTVIQTSGDGNMKNVVYSIFGKDVAEAILEVNYKYEDMILTGVVGKPEIARSNRSKQMFFVNKRFVKDKVLSGATEKAFKGMLPIGKYGFLIINIDMDPSKVDVNVHPAKLEVRFEEENKIFKAVYHAIQEALLKGELIENTEKEDAKNQEKELERQELEKRDYSQNFFQKILKHRNIEENIENAGMIDNDNANLIEQIYNDKKESNQEEQIQEETIKTDEVSIVKEDIKTEIDENLEKINSMINQIKQIETDVVSEVKPNFDEMYVKTFGKMPEKEEIIEYKEDAKIEAKDILEQENISVFEDIEEYNKQTYKFIGIAFATYIILEIDSQMYILDQHAAHERIMYEQIKKNFYSDETKDSQLMLLPDIITLSHKEMDIARENIELFEKVGFMLEEFGENTIKITGVPNVCIDLDTKELFLETLDEINTIAITAKQEKEEKLISTIACKAAVKANMALSPEEVDSLMEQLLKLPNPFTCPHGRPTAIKMSKIDIEKKFARR